MTKVEMIGQNTTYNIYLLSQPRVTSAQINFNLSAVEEMSVVAFGLY